MREILSTTDAPEPTANYSQGVAAGDLVFTAGQIPLTPSGDLLDGTVTEQTHRCVENVEAILAAAGTSLENALKVTIFLADVDEGSTVDAAYAEHFDGEPPARTMIEVGPGGIARGAALEIEAVAVREA